MNKIRCAVIMMMVLLCLSGCYALKPMYDEEDADRVTRKGTELMQEWLDKNMPEARLLECRADTLMSYVDGNKYLTEYARGSLEEEGRITDFAIDTTTGDVYFEMDQDTQRFLEQVVAVCLCESLGLMQDCDEDGLSCSIMAPSYDLEHFDCFDYGLPAGVTDLGEFVKNPEGRPLIHISGVQISVPDDTALSVYDLKAFERVSLQCGFLMDGLDMANSRQTVTFGSASAHLYEYGVLLERDDYFLWGAVHVRAEQRDSTTGSVTSSEQYFDPELLDFEETENGFRFDFPKKYQTWKFRICAGEDSELLRHHYIYHFGNYELTLGWKEQSPGCYVMVSENQTMMDFDIKGYLEQAD